MSFPAFTKTYRAEMTSKSCVIQFILQTFLLRRSRNILFLETIEKKT
jgi:hypothetical protein